MQERILEHLADDDIPGANVQAQQLASIQHAKKIEGRIIARTQPKYDDQGV